MRVHFAAAIIVCTIAGIGGARAADLSLERGYAGHSHYYPVGQRAEQLVFYDFEPGVVTRAYWLAPWRNRHYFPATGIRPRRGRLERLSVGSTTRPAESYYRYWSTTSAFYPELPREGLRDYDAQPHIEHPIK